MTQKKLLIGLAAAVVLGIGWYLFRPELLFINQTVHEDFPSVQGQPTSAAGDQETVLAQGNFHKVAHQGMGKATIYQLAGGKRLLRLTDFETSNGPALHVYLVAAADATDSATVQSAGFIDLGALKGNIGAQNYEVPAEADLSTYQAVTIWCQRFSVNFGTAPLHKAK